MGKFNIFSYKTTHYIILLTYILAVFIMTLLFDYPLALSGWLVFCSVFSFLFYSIDKWNAHKNHWRIRESTLHFWSVIGGWPGAILAQQWLRHKTVKRSFQRVFWLTVVINIALVSLSMKMSLHS